MQSHGGCFGWRGRCSSLFVRRFKVSRLWRRFSSVQTAAVATHQRQHNKALHPTAYSFARSSLRFRRRVSLVVRLVRQLLLSSKAGNAPKLAHSYLREYGRIRPYSCPLLSKRFALYQFQSSPNARFRGGSNADREDSMLNARLCKRLTRNLSCKRLRRKCNSIPAPAQNTAKAAQFKAFLMRRTALAKLFANAWAFAFVYCKRGSGVIRFAHFCLCLRQIPARLSRSLRA